VVLIATFATSATKVPLGAVLDRPGIGFGDFWCQWIGLRENLQKTMVFTIKYGVFL
jgi:hypothetical protein